MFGLFDFLKIGAGVIAGAVVASVIAHGVGVSDGRKQVSADALATAVKFYRDKGMIKNEVDVADAAALCADFGLPDDELSDCVRRVREAAAQPGDVRPYPDS